MRDLCHSREQIRRGLLVFAIFTAVFAVFTSPLTAEEQILHLPLGEEPLVAPFLQDLQPGSLILHAGDCLAVKLYTLSSVTHVGLLLPGEAGNWIVYDSANGTGVRKTELQTYLKTCAPDKVTFFHPEREMTAAQQTRLKAALEEELGRPYGISHFVSGNAAEGMHCSEYVTRSLMKIDWLHANRPARVSPASLVQGIEEGQLYRAGDCLKIVQTEIPAPPLGRWYTRMWDSSKKTTAVTYRKWNRMVFCCD